MFFAISHQVNHQLLRTIIPFNSNMFVTQILFQRALIKINQRSSEIVQ